MNRNGARVGRQNRVPGGIQQLGRAHIAQRRRNAEIPTERMDLAAERHTVTTDEGCSPAAKRGRHGERAACGID